MPQPNLHDPIRPLPRLPYRIVGALVLLLVAGWTSAARTASVPADSRASIGELRVLPEWGQQIFAMGAGEFLPQSLRYRFTNEGDRQLDYEITADQPWLQLSRTSGRLQPEGRSEVVLNIDAKLARELTPGWHAVQVNFVNATSGKGSTTREVRLLARSEQGLEVRELPKHEPQELGRFRLANTGASDLEWEAQPSAPWLGAQPQAGTLAPGAKLEVALLRVGEPKAGRRQDSAALAFYNRTDGVGSSVRRIELAELPADPHADLERAEVQSLRTIEQHGITWTFADPVQAGQYVTGDWWVVGPVLVLDISPNSRSDGQRVRNGSMLNPSPKRGISQGYDSAAYDKYKSPDSYQDRLNVALDVDLMRPYLLRPENSLVSSISLPEAGARPQLKAAAILTCVDRIPAKGSFRPSYAGQDKRSRFVESQLKTELLHELQGPPSTPGWNKVERLFERPWLDHVPLWVGRYLHPADNMENYGREMSDAVSTAALMLHLDVPLEKKHLLLVRFVQLGIDLHGLLLDGGVWLPDGGHMSGRKWPILFAGLMLGDAQMQSIGVEYDPVTFGEDGQTFYVGDPRPELGYREADRGKPEWGVRHARKPEHDDARWRHTEKLSEGMQRNDERTHDLKYRLCCTANTWWGELLAARIMGAVELWNHAPLFDYQDRFYEENKARKIFDENMSLSRFYLQMWRRYREKY